MIVFFSLLSSNCFADLKEIYSSATTVGASKYLSQIKTNANNKKTKNKATSLTQNIDFTPGRVFKHKIKTRAFLFQPVFFIGDDALSLRWLEQNKTYFKKIHAIGVFITNKNTKLAAKIRQIDGIQVAAAQTDGLSRIVKTRHYPFVVIKQWVVQ